MMFHAGTVRGARGFTMLEIMIVIGIMAMVMAISLPALRKSGDREPLDMTVEMISSLTARARAEAILDRRKRLVIFNLGTNGEAGLALYGLPENRPGQLEDGGRVETVMAPQMLGTNRFPAVVGFEPPKVLEVWFRPDGTCDGAEFDMKEGGRVYRLFLEPSTSLTMVTEQ